MVITACRASFTGDAVNHSQKGVHTTYSYSQLTTCNRLKNIVLSTQRLELIHVLIDTGLHRRHALHAAGTPTMPLMVRNVTEVGGRGSMPLLPIVTAGTGIAPMGTPSPSLKLPGKGTPLSSAPRPNTPPAGGDSVHALAPVAVVGSASCTGGDDDVLLCKFTTTTPTAPRAFAGGGACSDGGIPHAAYARTIGCFPHPTPSWKKLFDNVAFKTRVPISRFHKNATQKSACTVTVAERDSISLSCSMPTRP